MVFAILASKLAHFLTNPCFSPGRGELDAETSAPLRFPVRVKCPAGAAPGHSKTPLPWCRPRSGQGCPARSPAPAMERCQGHFPPLIVSNWRPIHEGPAHGASPAAFRIVARTRADMWKLWWSSSSSAGATAGIRPRSFASSSSPKVPASGIPSWRATRRAACALLQPPAPAERSAPQAAHPE